MWLLRTCDKNHGTRNRRQQVLAATSHWDEEYSSDGSSDASLAAEDIVLQVFAGRRSGPLRGETVATLARHPPLHPSSAEMARSAHQGPARGACHPRPSNSGTSSPIRRKRPFWEQPPPLCNLTPPSRPKPIFSSLLWTRMTMGNALMAMNTRMLLSLWTKMPAQLWSPAPLHRCHQQPPSHPVQCPMS